MPDKTSHGLAGGLNNYGGPDFSFAEVLGMSLPGTAAIPAVRADRCARVKRAAADASLFERDGRAVVFTSLEDLWRHVLQAE